MAEATHPSDADLRAIKRQVSKLLLKEPGVTGVGIADGHLMVYLEEGSDPVRSRVLNIIHSLIGDVAAVAFKVTGIFRAR